MQEGIRWSCSSLMQLLPSLVAGHLRQECLYMGGGAIARGGAWCTTRRMSADVSPAGVTGSECDEAATGSSLDGKPPGSEQDIVLAAKRMQLFTRVMDLFGPQQRVPIVPAHTAGKWHVDLRLPEMKWVLQGDDTATEYRFPGKRLSCSADTIQEAKRAAVRLALSSWAAVGLVSGCDAPSLLGHPAPIHFAGEKPIASYIDNAALKKVPVQKWTGRTHVITHALDAQDAVRLITEQAGKSELGEILGFDLEFPPNFYRSGSVQLPTVIQVAAADDVYVFHVNNFAPKRRDDRFHERVLPLRPLLENPALIKSGVGVLGDRDMIHKFAPAVQSRGWLELMTIATELDFRRKSLQGLCAMLLGFSISKKEQLSNWGGRKLFPKQIDYAATDAWVSRELALKLLQLRRAHRPGGGDIAAIVC